MVNLVQLIFTFSYPEIPYPRTLAAAKVYFVESAHAICYTARQAACQATRAVWEAADAALDAANQDEEECIDCYKAGVTIIYQINFLMGEPKRRDPCHRPQRIRFLRPCRQEGDLTVEI